MRRRRLWERLAGAIAFVGLVVCLGVCLAVSNDAQGTSRVVNYAGITRGCTQRVVKLEMSGVNADALIEYLDGILSELQSGGGEFEITPIRDGAFQDELSIEREAWGRLKDEIYLLRDSHDEDVLERLLADSEEYYSLCDRTVSAAEEYSAGLDARLSLLEGVSIVFLALLGLVVFHQLYLSYASLRSIAALEGKAYVDTMTGSKNRRYFDEISEDYAAEGGFCIAYIDIDNLKDVNDTLGHEEGDAYIKTVVQAIRDQFRDSDTIFRLGGDEFALLLEGCSEERASSALRRAFDLVEESSQDGIPRGFSYGIACVSAGENVALEQALHEADKRMYDQKASRKRGR